ncbi:hypothetical protein B0H21DRAFT_700203 [Amylocystis lapponica]|nr:hypothetical protein B0H21DRAFT_700203 [Amylocystis lapponica]
MSANIEVFPPTDGSIPVIPGFLDFHAERNPTYPMFVFPSDDIPSISFREFAEATHRIAHILRPTRSGPDGAVVAVLIHCDTILYDALLVGIIRAGMVPFPMSERNSPPAVASMLSRSNCHNVVLQPAFASLVAEARALLPSSHHVHLDMLPEFAEILPTLSSSTASTPVPAVKAYPAPEHPRSPTAVMLYIHSSGSTNHPKPIPQTDEALQKWCTFPWATEARAHALRWGAMALPPFHTIGLCYQLLVPLLSGYPSALFAPCAPAPPVVPNTENILEASRITGVTALLNVPTFLEEWAQDDNAIEYLKTLKCVSFAGGPLSVASGNKLTSAGVNIYSCYGATEAGTLSTLMDISDNDADPVNRTRADWEYISLPSICNVRWVSQGDGTFELQFISCPTHKCSVENIELETGERGYSTSDVFEPHPTKAGLWRTIGRLDDLIVLGTGEKSVPSPQEHIIMASPLVSGALMFGRGRMHVGVLVEPRAAYTVPWGDEKAAAEYRNAIWPKVEEANQIAPAYGRIFKEMILISDPARPFERAAKATINRKKVIAQYDEDIDAFLSATFLRNHIMGILRASSDPAANAAASQVTTNFVYTYPTLAGLADAVARLVQPGSTAAEPTPVEQINAMIAKYTARLPRAFTKIGRYDKDLVVVLTGSTGGLGSHLVADLLGDARVTRVYALNRGTGLAERQRRAFENAQLPLDLLSSPKLVLLDADFAREDFGLKPTVLEEIRSTATHVVHNAWKVDFNLSLPSFESQVATSVRLACVAPGSRFIFTSSVSVAMGTVGVNSGRVREEPLHEPELALVNGYAQSKYVVEEVLANARDLGKDVTTVRIGQICGSSQSGTWNTSEWVPSLVKSSISLGCWPALDGVVAWVPVDVVANAMVDVMTNGQSPVLVNFLHPRPVSWSAILDAMNQEFNVTLPSVPLGSWVKKLEDISESASAQDLENTPALKLLQYFREIVTVEGLKQGGLEDLEVGGIPRFETSKAQTVSPTLANLRCLGAENVKAWVQYWRAKAFIA